MSLVDRVMTVFLALLFGFAGLDKLLHIPGFVKAIDSYRVLPIPTGSVIAPVVIAAELAVAIGLLRAQWRRTAALQAAILMTLFTLGLIGNRLLGASDRICGCWFSISMAQGDIHFVLNGMIIAMSLFVWRASQPRTTARMD